jgi:hypothetical protein
MAEARQRSDSLQVQLAASETARREAQAALEAGYSEREALQQQVGQLQQELAGLRSDLGCRQDEARALEVQNAMAEGRARDAQVGGPRCIDAWSRLVALLMV